MKSTRASHVPSHAINQRVQQAHGLREADDGGSHYGRVCCEFTPRT